MDVVSSVRKCLATWGKGGDIECRNLLFTAHCNPSDPANLHVLMTAYNTLLSGVFSIWTPPQPLSVQAFVEFLRGVLTSLPSSSSDASAIPNFASHFGDHLVDILWTMDAQLDGFLEDVQAEITSVGSQESPTSPQATATLAKAKKKKATVEVDKERVHAVVKGLLELGIVTAAACRERLDSSVLAAVGLIPDKGVLDKKEIRTRTGIFYKQNKFNLLREQSEGYTKLITEVTNGMGPSHAPNTGLPTEEPAAIDGRAQKVWNKIISLIGYFDLDPNRALDLILDVFSTHLTTHHAFFLALLSCSPWTTPRRRAILQHQQEMVLDTKPPSFVGKSFDEVLEMVQKVPSGPEETSGDGSHVLAQVLGFKFTHYQTVSSEQTPRALLLMCAVLIREGFMTLEEIYPHLGPADTDMETVRTEYLENVKVRISAAKVSALAMAAPLEGSASQTKAKVTVKEEPKKPEEKKVNQKVGLLTALLAVGELRPAIAILTKYPWLVDPYPEIADLLIRIMRRSTDDLYASIYHSKERQADFSQPRARYGAAGVARPTVRKPMLTTWAPTPPSTSSTDFVFFFPHWHDQVPVASTLDDIEFAVAPFMRFLGPHLSRDPLFISKFMRLGRVHIANNDPVDPETKKPIGEIDPEHPVRQFWLKVVRLHMLPALPLIRGNTISTVEVWHIIRSFDVTVRWQLYGEWKNSVYKSHHELRVRQVQADRESKHILRRLSSKSIDALAGSIAKLAHNNPCIFFSHAVNQVMAYDNMADVVIQGLKFVTILGFDVLVFLIIDAFANPNKERVKDDGVHISDWLQSLALFTGMLFRRYSTDLTPVLKYVAHQLLNDKTSEIVVLRELIWKMAGIEPLPSMNDAQITAMAGGPILRIQALASDTRGAKFDPEEASLKGPQRLGSALLSSKLALPLLVQVAQQRQSCVFKAPDAPLKSLASLFDNLHGVLLQYIDLLTSPGIISPEDYATKVLPSFEELGEKYGIVAPICMQIIRPVLQKKLLTKALAMQEQERIANEEAEKRLKAALTAKREPGTAGASASRVATPEDSTVAKPEPGEGGEGPLEDAAMEVDSATPQPSQQPESPWLPELSELFDAVKKIAPSNALEVIGVGFYTTFWQLSTYDLSPPSTRYNEEGALLRALSRQEDNNYARSKATTHRNRRDRYNMFVELLSQEFKEQTVARAFTIKRLAREKPMWFIHAPKSATLINCLIEHCIQPRTFLSPMDADFCAQFIKVLHLQGTPGFHTLMCFDKLLGDHVKVVLFSCTGFEARNYGRFLLGILNDLHKWNTEEQTYVQENRSKSGGKYIPLPGMQRVLASKSATGETVILSWNNFQQVLRKWHRKLAKSFIDCIQTGEFMHIYNAVLVLKEIITVFPLADVTTVGPEIYAVVEKLAETETRSDLKMLAMAYTHSLKKRETFWAGAKLPSKTNGITSSTATTASPAPEKSRPAAKGAPSDENRRSTPQPPPSAPRALSQSSAAPTESLQSTKLAMESIPRPEVVKRVRGDAKNGESSRPPADQPKTDGPTPGMAIPVHVSNEGRTDSPSSHPNMYPPRPSQTERGRNDERGSRGDILPPMPPPANPSQTPSAQELRETARQSVRDQHRPDAREPKAQGGSRANSPHVRSSSPTNSSRPGTRPPSADSRGSGGRMRSDRHERSERGNPEPEDRDRKDASREGPAVTRRDSLTHTRERANRDRDSDRGRDRHGDRERDKDRDRDRDRDRSERERDRDRDRERDRDRDRHRRDDKDRDRKERDNAAASRGPGTPTASNLEGLPNRPEPSRHNRPSQNGDDGLGKRRRLGDDDSERASKRDRSSRKDGHRDSDRGRRGGQDKDAHDRRGDSDRRRKEREAENETRGGPSEKPNEKRPPPPSVSIGTVDDARSAPSPVDKSGPLPKGPRAMADTPRTVEERSQEPMREQPDRRNAGTTNAVGNNRNVPTGPNALGGPSNNMGSLRSRIGDQPPFKDRNSFQGQQSLPQPPSRDRNAPSGHHPLPAPPISTPTGPTHYNRMLSGANTSRSSEESDHGRKRTASEREKEGGDAPSGSTEAPTQPPKRPKINRNRYTGNSGSGAAIARKLLPIDPHAGERNQRRQD